MLRALIGWIFGFISGFLVFSGFITGDTFTAYVSIAMSAITLIGCIVFSKRHHDRKKKEYYDRIKGGMYT